MEEYTVSDTDKALILETFQITEKEIDKRIEELQEWTKNFLQLPEDAQGIIINQIKISKVNITYSIYILI